MVNKKKDVTPEETIVKLSAQLRERQKRLMETKNRVRILETTLSYSRSQLGVARLYVERYQKVYSEAKQYFDRAFRLYTRMSTLLRIVEELIKKAAGLPSAKLEKFDLGAALKEAEGFLRETWWRNLPDLGQRPDIDRIDWDLDRIPKSKDLEEENDLPEDESSEEEEPEEAEEE